MRHAATSVRYGAAWAVVLLLASGCGPAADDAPRADDVPIAIADQEDAVCGMLVREQSAPRAQVVHRDGERAFFCSIGDLLVYLDAPSPHGPVRAIFVEVMEPGEDPARHHTGSHPWHEARSATYVVGVERPAIMGEPVLAYASAAEARSVAEAHAGARVLDFEALMDRWRERQAAR
jgi:nitrous oxide reductase accessory protein NosL